MKRTVSIIALSLLIGTSVFAEWVDVDGVGQGDINVLNTVDQCYIVSLCLDSAGNPHVAWTEMVPGNSEIYYLKWNGSAWVDSDGIGQGDINISNTPGSSSSPSLCLDDSGNPHIAWQDWVGGNLEIFYLEWDGSSWVDADGAAPTLINISITSDNSVAPSLCLDSLDNPHIAWKEDFGMMGPTEIYYLRWDGSSWVDADGVGQSDINVSNTGATGSTTPSLHLGTSDYPHIAWLEWTAPGQAVYYLEWNGSAWTDADGTGQTGINIYGSATSSFITPKLMLDSLQRPNIAWKSVVSVPWSYEIGFRKWNGSTWVDADGIGQSDTILYSDSGVTNAVFSFSLDNLDIPHLSWAQGAEYICYLKWNGDEWVDADENGQDDIRVYDSPTGARYASLCLDGSANPCVAWRETIGAEADIYCLRWISPEPAPTPVPPEHEELFISKNIFNPAVGETVEIRWAVLGTDEVFLGVYNTAGELVRKLEGQGVSFVGLTRTTEWDGRNDAGDLVASGVYIIHLKGSRAFSGKIVVIK